jgi:hypothetical protein
VLDAARVAERNAVLKANLLESEMEYYKAPKFIEMDTEKLIQMNTEIADLKALYEEEISARVEKLLMHCPPYQIPKVHPQPSLAPFAG